MAAYTLIGRNTTPSAERSITTSVAPPVTEPGIVQATVICHAELAVEVTDVGALVLA